MSQRFTGTESASLLATMPAFSGPGAFVNGAIVSAEACESGPVAGERCRVAAEALGARPAARGAAERLVGRAAVLVPRPLNSATLGGVGPTAAAAWKTSRGFFAAAGRDCHRATRGQQTQEREGVLIQNMEYVSFGLTLQLGHYG